MLIIKFRQKIDNDMLHKRTEIQFDVHPAPGECHYTFLEYTLKNYGRIILMFYFPVSFVYIKYRWFFKGEVIKCIFEAVSKQNTQ